MNKKIVLGLGLCLLLTVINLHRAMDNYGITDAKFKVGVLADESSSSEGYSWSFNNFQLDCVYTGTGGIPGKTIELFGEYTGVVKENGEVVIPVPKSAIGCFLGGANLCFSKTCREVLPGDAVYID